MYFDADFKSKFIIETTGLFSHIMDKQILESFVFIHDNGSKTLICSDMEGLTNTYNGRTDGEAGRIGKMMRLTQP